MGMIGEFVITWNSPNHETGMLPRLLGAALGIVMLTSPSFGQGATRDGQREFDVEIDNWNT